MAELTGQTEAECQPDPLRIAASSLLTPGLSIGAESKTTGTLGLFVVDATGTLCLLSAKHILARDDSPKALSRIVHPASDDADGQNPGHIASLWWWLSRVDAALAKIEADVVCNIEQFETDVTIQSFREPKVDDILEKSGRSSGVTRAKVTDCYVPADGLPETLKLRRLDGETDPISCKGDSGAVWYDPITGEGVGLHHGGVEERAVAVPLVTIKEAWDIEPWNGELL